MVTLMLFGGLRRCEVLGLRMPDVRPGERRVFVAAGKGGHQRIVPVAPAFFESLSTAISTSNVRSAVSPIMSSWSSNVPDEASRFPQPVSMRFLLVPAPEAGCRMRRVTNFVILVFTRLCDLGMVLEAIQAQAGHASIESTRIYLHLANDWLIGEYSKAMDILDGTPVT